MATGNTQDYEKLRSNKNIGVWIGQTSNATGVQDVDVPLPAEINEGGTGAMLNAAVSTSWNDTDFGIQEADTSSDPSFADESTFEDLGAANYGGQFSFYYPQDYDDNSNQHSLVYDMTDVPWEHKDIVMRIDGSKDNVNVPVADGDFLHVFRTWVDSETNATDATEAYRRTVGFQSRGDAAFYTIAGAHTITAIEPPAGWTADSTGRLRATVQDRDYTNALTFSTSDASVVRIAPGGFYQVTGITGATADILIEDRNAGTSVTVAVTVA